MTQATPLISVEELSGRLTAPETAILDCRFDLMAPAAGRQQWLEGHIPGAVYADLDRDLAGPTNPQSGRHPLPDADELARFLGTAGISNDSEVIVYDAGSGAFAARAWWLLRWLSHDRVRLLDGGFAAWQAAGEQTEQGEVIRPARQFVAQPRSEAVMTTADVAALGAADRAAIVDARDAPRFRGEVEPIDPVAGHVPGARNLPFTENLDANGLWRSAESLRQVWQALDGGAPSGDWAVMCGSGVTACHLAVSAELAGLPPPRLYVGSFSEWIRDPDRPVGRTE